MEHRIEIATRDRDDAYDWCVAQDWFPGVDFEFTNGTRTWFGFRDEAKAEAFAKVWDTVDAIHTGKAKAVANDNESIAEPRPRNRDGETTE
jgi:hypothetical protein